ncbi:MAG: 16S rRNA (cytidine(1402)-2'-O)-methyltransferase [Lachnospiraceae bacterium]|nr:16S rRNA (cytidine(1402)-2'-O)-methyltransferase [Lachnospiraceae bacterium]
MFDEGGKKGILYLCATPIGNLKDISLRVIDTLREADLIACEDTRNSIKLLNHFGISKPLTSYHEHNKYDKAKELALKLHEGKNIALITDAGTPGISDPGEVIARMCREEGITVTSLPGPCAAITALSASGMPSRRFCFEGFLSSDKKERERVLSELKNDTRTIILYEAPHHLLKTLKELYEALGDRRLTLCRELTKIHEEFISLSLREAVKLYEEKAPRGEYVLILEGKDPVKLKEEQTEDFKNLSIKEHVGYYEAMGHDSKESMKLAAKDRGVSKRDIYNALVRGEE